MTCDLLLVLPAALFVRNYVSSGFLEGLLDRGLKVTVVAPRATNPSIVEAVRSRAQVIALESVQPPPLRLRMLELLHLAVSVHRRAHPEYGFRFQYYALRLRYATVAIAMRLWWLVDLVADAEAVMRGVMRRLRPTRKAAALVKDQAPRVVLWPTTLSILRDFDLMQAVHRRAIPIVFAEGSWDNLTTKGPMWPPPTRVLVWGDYSARHAREWHGVPDAHIAITGPPHFQVYSKASRLSDRGAWCRANGVDPSLPLLLFAGTAVSKWAREQGSLRALSRMIGTGELPPMTIWYRPHPRGPGLADRDEMGRIPHVRIDPGVGASPEAAVGWTLHDRDALQRAEVLASCDLVVSAFSTLIVEAAILGKPGVLVSPGRGPGHGRDYFPALEFTHIRYVQSAPYLRTAHDDVELLACVRELLGTTSAAQAEAQRRFGLSIASCAEDPQQRIAAEIHTLLARTPSQTLARKPAR